MIDEINIDNLPEDSYERTIVSYLWFPIALSLKNLKRPMTLEEVHDRIANEYPNLIDVRDVELVLGSLAFGGLIRVLSDPYTATYVKKGGGLDQAVTGSLDESSPAGLYRQLGNSWLREALEAIKQRFSDVPMEMKGPPENKNGTDRVEEIPASDRIVKIDHNSQETKDLVASFNEVILKLDQQNDPQEFDEETWRFIIEFKAGTHLMEANQIDIALVERLLVRPALWLAKRFTDTVVGQVCLAVAAAVAALFGIPMPG